MTDGGLDTIRRALELGAHVLTADPWQLPSQLTAILRDDPAATHLLESIQRETRHPWLGLRNSARLESSQALIRSCDGAGEVLHLSVSYDGCLAISESFMGGLSIWNLETGVGLRHFDPPVWRLENAGEMPQAFGRMKIAADDVHAYGATRTGGVRVFKLESASIVRTEWDTLLPGRSIKLSDDSTYAIGIPDDAVDRPVVRWNLDDFSYEYLLGPEFVAGRSCAFTNDGAWLVTYSADGEVVACCTEDTSRSVRCPGYPGVESGPIAVSNSLEFLFSASADGRVDRLNLQSRVAARLPGSGTDEDDDRVTDLLLSDDETYLAAAYSTGELRIWRHPTGSRPESGTILAHDGRFVCSDRIPSSNRLATASRGGVINIWDVAAIPALDDPLRLSGAIADVGFMNKDGTAIASAQTGGLTLWSASSGEPVGSRFLEDVLFHSVQQLNGENLLAAGSADGEIYIVDTDRLDIVNQWQAHDAEVSGLARTPDGQYLLTCSNDHTVRAWRISEKRTVSVLEEHTQAVRKVALSPDAHLVATAGWDESTCIWDWRAGEIIKTLTGHDGPVRDAAFAMDGRLLATSSWDGIIVWDCKTWTKAGHLVGHSDLVESIAAGPSAAQLVSCSNDRTIRVWDLETLALVAVYTHDCSVGTCAVHPRESIACAGDHFGRVLFFDLRSMDVVSPYTAMAPLTGVSKIAPGVRTKYFGA